MYTLRILILTIACIPCISHAIPEYKKAQLFQAVLDKNNDVIREHVREYPHEPNPVITTETVYSTRGKKEEDHNTLLHILCKMGNEDGVKALLNTHNVNLNVRNTYGETPLHKTVKHGYYDLTINLLNDQANPNVRDLEDKTPLEKGLEYAQRGSYTPSQRQQIKATCSKIVTYPVDLAYLDTLTAKDLTKKESTQRARALKSVITHAQKRLNNIENDFIIWTS